MVIKACLTNNCKVYLSPTSIPRTRFTLVSRPKSRTIPTTRTRYTFVARPKPTPLNIDESKTKDHCKPKKIGDTFDHKQNE